jgi:uncharacterized membrane protein YeaQ/YmgE (transglycosylase-associated protein family)
MPIVVMVITGLAVGALARLVLAGKDRGGILVTSVLGVAGALAAGLVGGRLGWFGSGESAGIIVSAVGSVVLLWWYRAWVGSGRKAEGHAG